MSEAKRMTEKEYWRRCFLAALTGVAMRPGWSRKAIVEEAANIASLIMSSAHATDGQEVDNG